jgi:hypothetical protein
MTLLEQLLATQAELRKLLEEQQALLSAVPHRARRAADREKQSLSLKNNLTGEEE